MGRGAAPGAVGVASRCASPPLYNKPSVGSPPVTCQSGGIGAAPGSGAGPKSTAAMAATVPGGRGATAGATTTGGNGGTGTAANGAARAGTTAWTAATSTAARGTGTPGGTGSKGGSAPATASADTGQDKQLRGAKMTSPVWLPHRPRPCALPALLRQHILRPGRNWKPGLSPTNSRAPNVLPVRPATVPLPHRLVETRD